MPGLCASGPSGTGQGGGTRQAGSQAQVLYVSPPSSGLMTGRRQVGARPSPGACTCVAGPKAVADVPGIPTPDTKLLAGCRARGSRVLYIMRACLLPHGLLEPPVVRASFSRGVRNPAYVSAGQSPAQQPARSRPCSARFRSRIRGFPPGVVGPVAAKECSSTRCALVPGMEKKSGSGPERH